jgi:hypothetical protein
MLIMAFSGGVNPSSWVSMRPPLRCDTGRSITPTLMRSPSSTFSSSYDLREIKGGCARRSGWCSVGKLTALLCTVTAMITVSG